MYPTKQGLEDLIREKRMLSKSPPIISSIPFLAGHRRSTSRNRCKVIGGSGWAGMGQVGAEGVSGFQQCFPDGPLDSQTFSGAGTIRKGLGFEQFVGISSVVTKVITQLVCYESLFVVPMLFMAAVPGNIVD